MKKFATCPATLSEMHKEREALRRKEIAAWKPSRHSTKEIKEAVQRAEVRLHKRLSLNRALHRNAGHHQQQHFNRHLLMIPA